LLLRRRKPAVSIIAPAFSVFGLMFQEIGIGLLGFVSRMVFSPPIRGQ
jgi:hypothetical protein